MSTLSFQPEANRYYADGHWREGDLWEEFAARADEAPDKVAFVLSEGEVTYDQLRGAAIALSGRLAALSAEPGDAVILIGRHSVAAVVALLGCLHRGLIVAPLPPMFSVAQLSALGAQMQARGVVAFGGEAELEKAARVAGEVDFVLPISEPVLRELFAEQAPPERTARAADDIAMVLHSSGTTSTPKGIVHSSNTLRYATEGVAGAGGSAATTCRSSCASSASSAPSSSATSRCCCWAGPACC